MLKKYMQSNMVRYRVKYDKRYSEYSDRIPNEISLVFAVGESVVAAFVVLAMTACSHIQNTGI